MLRYLIIKELVFLGVLGLLGAGLVAPLRAWKVPPLARLALAPAFGFAAAMCLLQTVNFLVPLRWALWWLLLPATALSLFWAARTHRRAGGSLSVRGVLWPGAARDLAALAVVLAIPLLVLNSPLDARYSPGPVAVGIFDSQTYVNFTQGFQDYTNREPLKEVLFPFPSHEYDDVAWGPPWHLTLRSGWGFKWQHSGSSTVPAAVGATFGWPAWRMQAPFSIALLLIVALGTAGLIRAIVPARWPAVFGGLAAAGPVLFTLFGDGSQGLLSGVALVPPFLLAAWFLVTRRSWAAALLTGLVLAGFHTGYPEIFPQAAATLALLTGVAIGAHLLRTRRVDRAALRSVVLLGAVVGATTVLASPRSSVWLFEYFRRQAVDRDAFIAITPSNLYDMSAGKLAGWLTQTLEFYDIAFFDPSGGRFLLVGVLLPLVLLLGAGVAFWRIPASRALLAFAVVACAQAYVTSTGLGCSYCVQRTLLTLAPVVAAGIWVGLYAVGAFGGLWRTAATVLGTLAVVAAGATTFDVRDRVTAGVMASSDMEPTLEQVAKLPPGTLGMEGFSAIPYESWTEQAWWYQALAETTDHRLSTVAAYQDYAGYWYTQPRPERDPAYDPGYDYVLSRFGQLDTGREEIYRHGPVVLSKRVRPFDVTVARGAVVDTARRDPAGVPWVQKPANLVNIEDGPLTFWIAADTPQTAYLTVILQGPPGTRLQAPGARQRKLGGNRHATCVPVNGPDAQRVATGTVTPEPPDMGPPTGGEFDPVPTPAKAVRLESVRASATPCAPGLRGLAL